MINDQDGDFLSLYLGQISILLQLSMFQPLYLELSVFLMHLLKQEDCELSDMLKTETEGIIHDLGLDSKNFLDERLDCYGKEEDRLSCFISFCQKAVETTEAYRMNMEMNDKPIQKSINDRRYVAIYEAASRLEQVVRDSKTITKS